MIRHRQKMSRGVVPLSRAQRASVTEFRRRVWAKVAPSKDAPMPDDDGIVYAVALVADERDLNDYVNDPALNRGACA